MTLLAVAIVAVLVVALDAFVYLSLRDRLRDNLQETLEARSELALQLADQLGPEQLAEQLTEVGVPAVVTLPDGDVVVADPAARRFVELPPGQRARIDAEQESLERPLPGGGSVMVLASRAGVESTLRRVLVLELIGSAVAIALSVIVLARMSRVVLRPVDRIVDIARRIAAGREGGRLRPDRTDTELGRMAAAFDEMLDALESAVEEARVSELRSRRFLADAAHQLRTPIAGMRASVETLLRDPDHGQRDRLLANLAHESVRLGQLVTSLLRVAHLDRGDEPVREAVDLVGLVRAELSRAREISPELQVDLQVEPGAATLVEVEAAAIREALANLLDNARRYAEDQVEVTVTADGDHVEVLVRDDGPGVEDEDRERIFERFVTLDDRGGSGLGLPIARGIARAHGGELSYEREAFRLRLPRDAGVTDRPEPSPIISR